MARPLKLNAVIAVEKGVKSRSLGVVSELYKTIQKPELFDGFVRTYSKLNEEDPDLPLDRKVVQFRMQDVLSALRLSKSELIDVLAQVDVGNTQARASVWVDGKEILPELPATTLLSLEKELIDLRSFVSQIPVLDNAETWKAERDDNTGYWITDVTSVHRTKKIVKSLVLIQPTKEHPGQAQAIQEDIVAGFWNTVKHSGAMKKLEKEAIAARVEKLLIAVKKAREEANGDTPVPEAPGIGAKLFDFIFEGR